MMDIAHIVIIILLLVIIAGVYTNTFLIFQTHEKCNSIENRQEDVANFLNSVISAGRGKFVGPGGSI